jgi:hypothetical protein
MTTIDSGPAVSGDVVCFDRDLRLAIAGYLARFKGDSCSCRV